MMGNFENTKSIQQEQGEKPKVAFESEKPENYFSRIQKQAQETISKFSLSMTDIKSTFENRAGAGSLESKSFGSEIDALSQRGKTENESFSSKFQKLRENIRNSKKEESDTEGKCPRCRQEIGAASKFCPNCGLNLTEQNQESGSEDIAKNLKEWDAQKDEASYSLDEISNIVGEKTNDFQSEMRNDTDLYNIKKEMFIAAGFIKGADIVFLPGDRRLGEVPKKTKPLLEEVQKLAQEAKILTTELGAKLSQEEYGQKKNRLKEITEKVKQLAGKIYTTATVNKESLREEWRNKNAEEQKAWLDKGSEKRTPETLVPQHAEKSEQPKNVGILDETARLRKINEEKIRKMKEGTS